jgi:hypothetical protein
MKFIGTFVKGQIQSGSKTRRGFVWMFDKTKTGGRWVLVKGSELGDLSREGYLYSKKMYNAYREKKNKTKLSEKSKQLWKSEIMKQININKSSSVYYSANNRLSSYYTPNSSLKKSSSVYYSPTNRLSSYYTPNSSLKKSMSPRIRRTKRTKRRTNKKQKRNNKKTRRKPIRRRR